MSHDVASYAGYNSRRLMISTFAISGAIAGLAGYVMFFLSYNSIPGLESPISEGFSGIAVALVGMLNPIAIIPSAILFGLLSGPLNGMIIAGFSPDVVLIFSGVVTYFVAISSLFLYLRPVKLIKDKIVFLKSQNHTRVSKGGR
ncbi:MAG: ABC transporter permease [Chlamydiia bacterium]|nr:ABC transporter permease [Chlamydiia bacterium]